MADVKKIVGTAIGLIFAGIFVMNLYPTFISSKPDTSTWDSTDKVAITLVGLSVAIGIGYKFIEAVMSD
jgi:F0F1-type ATP synthase membrane subunit a